MHKWDKRYLDIAMNVSTWSKDPSTQVGCVIVDPNGRPKSFGFNGFARGFDDTDDRWNDREFKYRHVIHAELNAVLHSNESLEGCTAYITHPACAHCTGMLRQKGIVKIVCYDAPEYMKARWDFSESTSVAAECGMEYIVHTRPESGCNTI